MKLVVLLSLTAVSESVVMQHTKTLSKMTLKDKKGKTEKTDLQTKLKENGPDLNLPKVSEVFAGRHEEEERIGVHHEEKGEQEFDKAFNDVIGVAKEMMHLHQSHEFSEAQRLAEQVKSGAKKKVAGIMKDMKYAEFEIKDAQRQKASSTSSGLLEKQARQRAKEKEVDHLMAAEKEAVQRAKEKEVDHLMAAEKEAVQRAKEELQRQHSQGASAKDSLISAPALIVVKETASTQAQVQTPAPTPTPFAASPAPTPTPTKVAVCEAKITSETTEVDNNGRTCIHKCQQKANCMNLCEITCTEGESHVSPTGFNGGSTQDNGGANGIVTYDAALDTPALLPTDGTPKVMPPPPPKQTGGRAGEAATKNPALQGDYKGPVLGDSSVCKGGCEQPNLNKPTGDHGVVVEQMWADGDHGNPHLRSDYPKVDYSQEGQNTHEWTQAEWTQAVTHMPGIPPSWEQWPVNWNVSIDGGMKFHIPGMRMKKLRDTNFAVSLGGGGCVSVTTQSGFMDILNYVGSGRFHLAQSGTSGGFWKAAMDWFAGSTPERRCSLLDPEVGSLPPKERTEALLTCMGCDGSWSECQNNLMKMGIEEKLSLFGPASGCIMDSKALVRNVKSAFECQKYFVRNKGQRHCNFANLQRGFISATFPQRRDVPVGVEMTDMGIWGVTKSNYELQKPFTGEPSYTAYRNIGASMIVFTSLRQIPELPVGMNLNRTLKLDDVSNKTHIITEWDAWKSHHESVYFENRAMGSQIAQHTALDLATMASNIAVSMIMDTTQILSAGLCRVKEGSHVTSRQLLPRLLGPVVRPLLKMWAKAEHSGIGTKNILNLMHSIWSKDVVTSIQSYWDQMEGWTFTDPPKNLHCRDKSVGEWLSMNNSQAFVGMDGTYMAAQRYFVPCYFDDESLTVLVLRTMLAPKGHLVKTDRGADAYGQVIVGDHGSLDPMGLGTLMNALFSQNAEIRWKKKNEMEPWHIILLDSTPKEFGLEVSYFGEYAPILHQVNTEVPKLLEGIGADCSRVHQWTKNVNRLFNESSPEFLKERSITNLTLTPVRNFRYEVDEGEQIILSKSKVTDTELDKYFFPHLKEEFQKAEHITEQSSLDLTGFFVAFEAWYLVLRGQTYGVEWLCKMLLDDCTQAMEMPHSFIKQVRWMYQLPEPYLQYMIEHDVHEPSLFGPPIEIAAEPENAKDSFKKVSLAQNEGFQVRTGSKASTAQDSASDLFKREIASLTYYVDKPTASPAQHSSRQADFKQTVASLTQQAGNNTRFKPSGRRAANAARLHQMLNLKRQTMVSK